MAYSSEGAWSYSFPADTDELSNLGVAQYTPVAIRASTSGVGVDQGGCSLIPWADGMQCVGVLMNNPKQGEGGTYCFRGIVRARCVGAWAIGDKVTPAVGGFKKAGDSDEAFAIALNDAVVGDFGVIQR